MENLEGKENFLRVEYTRRLEDLSPDAERRWGKMNVQQMIEHMAEYVRMGSGKMNVTVLTAEEQIPKMQAFLSSDKPFRENTPNALLPDVPPAARHSNTQAAIAELQQEIDSLFQVFEQNPDLKVANPFFGYLNFDMTIQLLHKHAWHHLRQFGIEE